jgi:UDPglucose--hexose-1-phosphate uridylyltransferase
MKRERGKAMPEIRHNVATGEWVIIAPDRAQRPGVFAAPGRAPTETCPTHVATCPFCLGNEAQTPPEVLRYPRSGSWQVRVVPNKFAALDKDLPRQFHSDDLHPHLTGVGWHEVVVESPRHNATPALQTDKEIARTLAAFQARGRDIARHPSIEHIVYLKNHGPGAGTSQEHPHSQIVALPLVPRRVQARAEVARRYLDQTGRCPVCDMWRAEVAHGERVVAESEHFVAFVPYAAFAAFHTWIVPKRHRASFCQADARELADLAGVLRGVLRKIYLGLGDPDYNYVIQSAPVRACRSDGLHWYLAVTPRLIPWGGFEMASGMFINTALPEDNARFLREVFVS